MYKLKMKFVCFVGMLCFILIVGVAHQIAANEALNEIPNNEIPVENDTRARRTQALDSEGESLRLSCESAAATAVESSNEITV